MVQMSVKLIAQCCFLLITTTTAAATRQETLLYANCPRENGEFVGTLRGRILLDRAFFDPARSDDENLRAGIEHQLRYLWGHYRNDAAAHAALQLSLSAEAPTITVLWRRERAYGRDLELPWSTSNPHLQIEDDYTRRAIARGRTRADDAALAADYELRFKLAICGRGQDPGTELHVPLPPDPWLAYWYVPAERHRPLRYYRERAVTNPCADNDFADLPHPYYYWYDWLPTRHGRDDDGGRFDCRRWLHAGVDYDYFAVALEHTGRANHDFSRLRRELSATPEAPLRATILVGAVDHSVTDLGLAGWQKLIGDGLAGALNQRTTAARKQWAEHPPRERGTAAFLELLAQLAEVLAIDGHSSTLEDGNLLVEVRGRLRKSNRPMCVRAYLGMTDVFGPQPPNHWPIVRRALAEDHLIVYWGHSGIGENLRLTQVENNLHVTHAQLQSELERSPLRLVAFISCYSYMYFGQDLLEAGAQRHGGGVFLFTGMEHSERESGPLAVLDLVDRVLAPDNPAGRLERLPMLGDDEFWLVKEVAGVRPLKP
jgi:hypothetical protein